MVDVRCLMFDVKRPEPRLFAKLILQPCGKGKEIRSFPHCSNSEDINLSNPGSDLAPSHVHMGVDIRYPFCYNPRPAKKHALAGVQFCLGGKR